MNEAKYLVNPVFYGSESYSKINQYIEDKKPSSVFILVDTNTQQNCLGLFLKNITTELQIEVIEIEPGEENKHIETCTGVWSALSELGADRKSLMINLGGGVVTDLGGFVASTFKRGIPFINVPTTLLSMVDASVGGKTGVDLGNLKNQVGVIVQAELVVVDSKYLQTLSSREMRSGLAEILKHGLIADESYWNRMSNLSSLDLSDLDTIIEHSVNIKSEIVSQDPYERSIRKNLNFGHTLGHAIESFYLTNPEKDKLLHGEAIAIGMILESYLSSEILNFPQKKLQDISNIIIDLFGFTDISTEDLNQIISLLKHDKKNSNGQVNFVLLKDIAVPKLDIIVSEELIIKSFDFYNSLNITSH
ncbi:3-dehydroquinate synthase [uncultured Christiangramia sp.]|uniref:3-dehydroquinate synthase n=1 Tax=uncultured Christiangramia sp. TaxID=503836 RepID=UPI00262CFE56|nr:3-dehydroquinate synthase [uncultured Christiangramia sp.]